MRCLSSRAPYTSTCLYLYPHEIYGSGGGLIMASINAAHLCIHFTKKNKRHNILTEVHIIFYIALIGDWSLLRSVKVEAHTTGEQSQMLSRKLMPFCFITSAALSWDQPIWEGLGFSGLIHEETHPCASNFIHSVFETVQAGCINSVLVQTVSSLCDLMWEKNISQYQC